MATIQVTRAGQGEYFMVLDDLATIKAAGQGTFDFCPPSSLERISDWLDYLTIDARNGKSL